MKIYVVAICGWDNDKIELTKSCWLSREKTKYELSRLYSVMCAWDCKIVEMEA